MPALRTPSILLLIGLPFTGTAPARADGAGAVRAGWQRRRGGA